MTAVTVIYWAGLLTMAAAAIASAFLAKRSPRRAGQFATVEAVAAAVVLGFAVWHERWWQAAVWALITGMALGSRWTCRRIDQLRTERDRWEINEQDGT